MTDVVRIQTRSLTKHFGALAALEECSLAVTTGEVFGLLGPNGAGKTTLVRLLLGFLRPTAGEASIDGLDCYRDALAVRRRVAYLPGEARLFRQMRGRHVLEFFAGVRPGALLGDALALAERLKLDLSRRVALMSTGTRQKLALAATLSAGAPILILDEPTANLDPSVRDDVLAMVREARGRGVTVLFSSHVFSEAEAVCDRVGILRSGRLVHVQRMSELRRQHRIHARLTGPMPPEPPDLDGSLVIHRGVDGRITVNAPGELAPLLGWLAALPLAEVRIEPIGLRDIYERFHPMGGTS